MDAYLAVASKREMRRYDSRPMPESKHRAWVVVGLTAARRSESHGLSRRR